MDERMDNFELEAEVVASAPLEVPETPAGYQDLADEDVVAL